MSYCRFKNTVPDMRDCLHDTGVSSEREAKARLAFFKLCIEGVQEYESNKEYYDNMTVDEDYDPEPQSRETY
jgi:hypothetical protein